MSAERVRRVCDGEELVWCDDEESVPASLMEADPRADTLQRRQSALSRHSPDAGALRKPALSERPQ